MIYFKLYQVGCFLTIIECYLTKFFKYVSIETLNRGGNIMVDGNKQVESLSIPQLDKLLKKELTMAQRDYVSAVLRQKKDYMLVKLYRANRQELNDLLSSGQLDNDLIKEAENYLQSMDVAEWEAKIDKLSYDELLAELQNYPVGSHKCVYIEERLMYEFDSSKKFLGLCHNSKKGRVFSSSDPRSKSYVDMYQDPDEYGWV